MVFVNGLVFLALVGRRCAQRIIHAIPYPLKLAITAGIGVFIAFVGLKNGGVVVASPATFVTHGDFSSGPVALCLAGIALTLVLVARRVPGAIIAAMAATTILGLFVPDGLGGSVTTLPRHSCPRPRPRRRCSCSSTCASSATPQRSACAAVHPDAAARGHVRQPGHAHRGDQARRVSRCPRTPAARRARAGRRLAGGDPQRAHGARPRWSATSSRRPGWKRAAAWASRR